MISFISLNLVSVIFAFLLDDIFGDPKTKFHPISLMGRFNRLLEKRLYKWDFLGGLLLTVLSTSLWTFAAFLILYFAHSYNVFLFVVFNSIIIFFAISAKSMKQHAMRVYEPLMENDLSTAQKELSMIVSRDTANMREDEVVRSAVESISENFTDGVLSPIFYSALGGGVGALFFKSISTLDSMIGYKNEKYFKFGKFAARFDDVLNFIPARLSVFIIALAAPLCKMSFKGALKSALKYRFSHESPNSAHSMSAFAGAMSITLGGAVKYFGVLKEKPFIGEGKADLKACKIKEAVKLFEASSILSAFVCFAVYLIIRIFFGCPLCV